MCREWARSSGSASNIVAWDCLLHISLHLTMVYYSLPGEHGRGGGSVQFRFTVLHRKEGEGSSSTELRRAVPGRKAAVECLQLVLARRDGDEASRTSGRASPTSLVVLHRFVRFRFHPLLLRNDHVQSLENHRHRAIPQLPHSAHQQGSLLGVQHPVLQTAHVSQPLQV